VLCRTSPNTAASANDGYVSDADVLASLADPDPPEAADRNVEDVVVMNSSHSPRRSKDGAGE
jgi:hypothetical protein